MVRKLKDILYFTVARYFRFFARIRLLRWKPRIVVITGSNGKTTALHLMEAQLGVRARYSHGANSSFGIPFDILGLKRVSYSPLEWFSLALRAPFSAWKKPPREEIYVVEADCDRPGEGRFLSSLLRPEAVVWLSSVRTHSKNFERIARAYRAPVEEVIAHEFGYFARHASSLVVANADNPLIRKQMKRAKAPVHELKEDERLRTYTLALTGSEFAIDGVTYRAPFLLPKETWYAIAASVKVAEYFGVQPASDLSHLTMPPGRSSILKGIKDTTIVDGSYNVNTDSVRVILGMVQGLPPPKWLILGDLTEQGRFEKEEHEKIARLLQDTDFEKIVLVGPRLARYALSLLNERAVSFEMPREALDHIEAELRGGETVVFKGARFLEGIIEHLLADKHDADKLCRREKVWRKRRAQWGL